MSRSPKGNYLILNAWRCFHPAKSAVGWGTRVTWESYDKTNPSDLTPANCELLP
jgi:hypothetical protein